MDVKFKVVDENGGYYGTYSKLEYAEEEAQVMSNEFEKDIFIEKITTEMVKCVIPD